MDLNFSTYKIHIHIHSKKEYNLEMMMVEHNKLLAIELYPKGFV